MRNIRQRIISLLLAFALLLTVAPVNVLSAEQGNGSESTSMNNYGAAVGAVATWKKSTVFMYADANGSGGTIVSASAFPAQLVIVDYYSDEAGTVVRYEVDAAPGYEWPEKHKDIHWVDKDSLEITYANGMTGVYDAEGNAVTELTMGVYDKPVISAGTTLQGGVEYQWQICYDRELDLWADIYGQDSADLDITIGMFASLLSDDDNVLVRCVSKSGSKTSISAPITVNVDFTDIDIDEVIDPNAPSVDICVDGEPAESITTSLDNAAFGATLTAYLRFAGDLTFNWEVLVDAEEDIWSTISSEAYVKLTYSDLIFKYIDDTSDVATIRLTVSNGEMELTDTFVVYRNALASIQNTAGETTGSVDVTVAGNLPDDAILNLTATGDTVPGVEASQVSLVLDVTITQEGAEWQPADGEIVRVSIPAAQLGLVDGQYFAVYHIHDGNTEMLGPYRVDNGYVTFDINGFSTVIVSTNYGAAIGGTAFWNKESVHLYSDHIADMNDGRLVSSNALPAKLVVQDYFLNATGTTLWYKVDAAPGYTWPELHADHHWVTAEMVDGINFTGETGIYDAEGNPVTEATVAAMQPITVEAETTLQSDSISYQWQICYDVENDLWVDITGQTSAEITITVNMIGALLDENNSAKLRCLPTVGSKTAISSEIVVTLDVPQQGEDEPYVDILVDDVSKDSVIISEYTDFASVLTASTNLTGTLTYKWDILYRPTTGMWKSIGTESSCAPVFNTAVAGGLNPNTYFHKVDDSTYRATIRVTVSDGVNSVTDIFVIDRVIDAVAPTAVANDNDAAVCSANDVIVAAEETEKYNIVFNFVFMHNMEIAADPEMMQVSGNTQLFNTIIFPDVVGYKPVVMDENGVYQEQNSYTFNGIYLTEDFELTVFYEPTEVSYTINIYWQNAENDGYTPVDTINDLKAFTGTVFGEEYFKGEFSFDGFAMAKFLSNKEDSGVAADGSTEYNLYFDRDYYLMKFDLDGGYGVQPIYARHGTSLHIPVPTKPGHAFVGWDQTAGALFDANDMRGDGIQDTVHPEMPIGNTAYKAIWKAAETAKVTIVYWGENPNDEGYSYIQSQVLDMKPGTVLSGLVCGLEYHIHGEGDCTYKCNQTEHAEHVDSCYGCDHGYSHKYTCYTAGGRQLISTTKPSQITNYSENGIYEYKTGFISTDTHYYLYFDGNWYCGQSSNGNKDDERRISFTCTHVHDINCFDCHIHTAACYGCTEHEHKDDCYWESLIGFKEDEYYYLVKSDKVAVRADGTTVVNVYYDRKEFTYTFYPRNSDNAYGSIKAKWGANIYTQWRAICTIADNTNNWTLNRDGDEPWTSYIGVMGTSDLNYYGYNTTGTSTAYYYFQKLDGTYPTSNSDTDNVVAVPAEGSNLGITPEDLVLFEGFTFVRGETKDRYGRNLVFTKREDADGTYGGAIFYYARKTATLEFNNGETIVKTVPGVMYQQSLGSYDFVPTAPSIYQPGTVVFAGWYLNPECSGEQVILSNTQMPDANVILYAKWVPVSHDVTVYRYKNADGTFPTGNDILLDTKVTHNTLVQQQYIPEDPEYGNYQFVGWFYMDGDEEKAFVFQDMPVTQDLQIYAKWSSNVRIPYVIRYMIQGMDIEVAAPETGSHYQGATKTFNAKTAGQLYADYQIGYFPTVTSTSSSFDEQGMEVFEYTFYYVSKPAVPYTVYYLAQHVKEDTETFGTVVINGFTFYKIKADKVVSDNRYSIVTENFVQVPGYMPDAYQKTLILDGSDGAVNALYFFYTIDQVHAYYKVTHYTQNLDGSWFEHSGYEAVGVIGATLIESPKTIEGFTYDPNVEGSNREGILTEEGLHLKLYYTRNKYAYTVQYVNQDNGQILWSDIFDGDNEKKLYMDQATYMAPQFFGTGDVYQRVSQANQTITIVTDESLNVMTFYYTERQVTLNYQVVGPAGATNFGSVIPGSEVIKMSSVNTANGSTASLLNPAFKFVGWFTDAPCTGEPVSTDAFFRPTKDANELWIDGTTFYAKFEYNLTSLTIHKTGWNTADPNQTFLFRVQGDDVDMIVSVHGNGSVTINGLTVGEQYTITEITDWSWRYEFDKTTLSNVTLVENVTNGATITLGLNGEITFANTREEDQWLDGDSWSDNRFAAPNNP